MTVPIKILSVLVVLVSVGKSSDGNYVTYTDTISNNLAPSLYGAVGSSNGAVITQFAPSLGTLEGITIQQQNYVTVDAISVVNAGEYIQGNNVTSWTWATQAAYALGVAGGTDPGVGVSFSDYGNYDSPVTPESAEVYFSTTINGTVISVNSNSFASYIGNGYASATLETGITTQIPPLPATVAGFTWLLLSQTIGGSITMNDTDTLTVTYEYTPFSVVPEPSSLLMCALGCVGLMTLSQFRLRNRLKDTIGLTKSGKSGVGRVG